MNSQWIALLFMCSVSAFGSKPQPNEKAETITAAIDSAGRHQLGAFFSKQQIDELEKYVQSYNSIKTAHDLHLVYKYLTMMDNSYSDSLSTKQRRNMDSFIDFTPINNIVSGINFDHFEGDAMLINPDLAGFKQKAQHTPETSDDDFIDLLITTYGDNKYYNYPLWMERTTDYGQGSMRLGDGSELAVFKKVQAALAANKEFEPELNEIRDMLFSAILYTTCYQYSSPKIIAEIEQIINSIKLSAEEQSKLKKRIEEFKKPPKELQLGCERKACDCGG